MPEFDYDEHLLQQRRALTGDIVVQLIDVSAVSRTDIAQLETTTVEQSAALQAQAACIDEQAEQIQELTGSLTATEHVKESFCEMYDGSIATVAERDQTIKALTARVDNTAAEWAFKLGRAEEEVQNGLRRITQLENDLRHADDRITKRDAAIRKAAEDNNHYIRKYRDTIASMLDAKEKATTRRRRNAAQRAHQYRLDIGHAVFTAVKIARTEKAQSFTDFRLRQAIHENLKAGL